MTNIKLKNIFVLFTVELLKIIYQPFYINIFDSLRYFVFQCLQLMVTYLAIESVLKLEMCP